MFAEQKSSDIMIFLSRMITEQLKPTQGIKATPLKTTPGHSVNLRMRYFTVEGGGKSKIKAGGVEINIIIHTHQLQDSIS